MGCRDLTQAGVASLIGRSRGADTSGMDADPGTEAAELSFEDMFELYESPLGLDELDDAEQIDRILDAFENAPEA